MSERSCVRRGASCSPPGNCKPGARRGCGEDYAIRKWYGKGGKWLYTECVLPSGEIVVVEGEKLDDVREAAVHCRERVVKTSEETRSEERVTGGTSSRSSLRLVEASGAGGRGDRQTSVASAPSLDSEVVRNDSGLSISSKSVRSESRERSSRLGKDFPSQPKSSQLPHSTTYGTFTLDLEAGSTPPPRRENRSWKVNLSEVAAKVPWFEMVLAIVWLVFILLFVQTLYLRKDKYGCYLCFMVQKAE